jgi:hypothetical protein
VQGMHCQVRQGSFASVACIVHACILRCSVKLMYSQLTQRKKLRGVRGLLGSNRPRRRCRSTHRRSTVWSTRGGASVGTYTNTQQHACGCSRPSLSSVAIHCIRKTVGTQPAHPVRCIPGTPASPYYPCSASASHLELAPPQSEQEVRYEAQCFPCIVNQHTSA